MIFPLPVNLLLHSFEDSIPRLCICSSALVIDLFEIMRSYVGKLYDGIWQKIAKMIGPREMRLPEQHCALEKDSQSRKRQHTRRTIERLAI